MPLFDRYIAVDWSAANTPKRGRDSIWIGELGPEGRVPSENPPTRHAAMAAIGARLLSARQRGERIMLGFDFVFGYPRGAAAAIGAASADLTDPPPRGGVRMRAKALTAGGPPKAVEGAARLSGMGSPLHQLRWSPSPATRGRIAARPEDWWGAQPPWLQLWSVLARLVTDSPDNNSNRFQLAEAINHRLADGPHFWGHPHQHSYATLHPKRPTAAYANIPERRAAERYVRSAQPVWKLTGVGSVGSQAMLGIARLAALRRDPRLVDDIAVWPFETGFADDLSKPITVTEIYPSLFPVTEADGLPRDRAQVEITTTRFAELDRAGLLQRFLSPPAGLTLEERAVLIAEEGWIAGAGHEALLAQLQSAA
jgi:precorrin-8X/cobalt-precorrin-8 methylmutase